MSRESNATKQTIARPHQIPRQCDSQAMTNNASRRRAMTMKQSTPHQIRHQWNSNDEETIKPAQDNSSKCGKPLPECPRMNDLDNRRLATIMLLQWKWIWFLALLEKMRDLFCAAMIIFPSTECARRNPNFPSPGMRRGHVLLTD